MINASRSYKVQTAPAVEPRSRRASILPLATLFTLVLGLAVGGVISAWQLYAHAAAHGSAASNTASVPGGLLQVNEVIPEHMAAMHAGKFAAVGMNMSGMGMDMPPAGYRRFTIDITLVGQARSGLRYAASDFVVAGVGMEPVTPMRYQLGDGVVPRGSVVSGSLVYQVPTAATSLMLRLAAGEPIQLALPEGATHGEHDHESSHP